MAEETKTEQTIPTPEEQTAAVKAAEEAKPKIEMEKKTAEDKKAAEGDMKANPFKVEEIKLPEGVEVDPELQKGFVELVNKHGLSREAAAELVTLQANAMKAVSDKSNGAWDEMQTTWQKEVSADPDVGGAKQETVLSAISKLVDHYGTPELRGVFDLTGAGNNVHVIKFLAKIAADLGEPGPVSGRPAGTPKDAATILYPNQGKAA